MQKVWFRKQIQLAKALKLPVIIHNREAHADSMEIIESEDISSIGGVFHCFSGSYEMAEKLLEMGLYLSVAGPVTFNNAKKLVEVVKKIPINRLLIETDAPYLAPEPFRGKRNNSGYIKFTAQKIAEIKDVTIEEVALQTSENAKRLFVIK
jgi:TatD DNase family protein